MSVTDPKLQCPSHYPVGCLLGCVDLTDCLAQDEYREKVRTAYHTLMESCFLVNSYICTTPLLSLNFEYILIEKKRRQIREKERNEKFILFSLFSWNIKLMVAVVILKEKLSLIISGYVNCSFQMVNRLPHLCSSVKIHRSWLWSFLSRESTKFVSLGHLFIDFH